MNIRELLPIGSVVLLKEGRKKLMIFGIKQTDESSGIEYDYIGVLYPEGTMGRNTHFLFNHENIEKIEFRGFEDEERAAFIQKLVEYYQKA